MEYVFEDFRNARVILQSKPAWAELETAIYSLSRAQILDRHERISKGPIAGGKEPPAGGQTAVNDLIEEIVSGSPGWASQPQLFRSADLRKWTMDFLKDGIGVEVSFNHAEAIPWQFTRLNIAGESERVIDSSRVDVGVVICASPSFKKWARMDGAVGTFPAFKAWLREMKPISRSRCSSSGSMLRTGERLPRSSGVRGKAESRLVEGSPNSGYLA